MISGIWYGEILVAIQLATKLKVPYRIWLRVLSVQCMCVRLFCLYVLLESKINKTATVVKWNGMIVCVCVLEICFYWQMIDCNIDSGSFHSTDLWRIFPLEIFDKTCINLLHREAVATSRKSKVIFSPFVFLAVESTSVKVDVLVLRMQNAPLISFGYLVQNFTCEPKSPSLFLRSHTRLVYF